MPREINPSKLKFKNVRGMEGIEDTDAFKELHTSVKSVGVLVPVMVYRENGELYIHDGHRRVLAAIKAGCKVPYVEVKPPEQLQLEQVIANSLHEGLNPLETAAALSHAINHYGCTQVYLADSLGKSKGWVSQHLALLDLPDFVKDQVSSGKMAYRAAYELGTLPESDLTEEAVKGVKTVKDAKRRKRVLSRARETQQARVEVPEVNWDELDENVILVHSLLDSADGMIKQAVELAKEHDIEVEERWAAWASG